MAKNVYKEFKKTLGLGDRLADRVAAFGGSWYFIISFLIIIALWIAVNTLAAYFKTFDPYPFILLNLVLSTLAALQAPIIMMSQNRLEAKDRLRSEHDYHINLKAEREIQSLHKKIDRLLEQQRSKPPKE